MVCNVAAAAQVRGLGPGAVNGQVRGLWPGAVMSINVACRCVAYGLAQSVSRTVAVQLAIIERRHVRVFELVGELHCARC